MFPSSKSSRYGAVLTATIIGLVAMGAMAEDLSSSPQYVVEYRVYQLLDFGQNMYSFGPSPGTKMFANGQGYRTIHKGEIAGMAVEMDGANLTWNGAPEPNNYSFKKIYGRQIIATQGKDSKVVIREGDPLQYLIRNESGLFELHSVDPATEPNLDTGVFISLTPAETDDTKSWLQATFGFSYQWLKDRESYDNVRLEIGKPKMGINSMGFKLKFDLGKWICFKLDVPPPLNTHFLFMQINEKKEGGTQPVQAVEGNK